MDPSGNSPAEVEEQRSNRSWSDIMDEEDSVSHNSLVEEEENWQQDLTPEVKRTRLRPRPRSITASSVQSHGPEGNEITFANKLKNTAQQEPNSNVAFRGIKFFTNPSVSHVEFIKTIHKTLNNPCAIKTKECHHLQRMPSRPSHQNWNAVLSSPELVDALIAKTVFLPSQPHHPLPITPIRQRPTLITSPFASPDIPNLQIKNQLSPHGKIQNIWKQVYQEFPSIYTGKRLVNIYPDPENPLPPFIIISGHKILISFRGHQPICMHCNSKHHQTYNCALKDLRLCFHCGDDGHQYLDSHVRLNGKGQ